MKMKLDKCIINMPDTGECKIDLEKAFKCFDEQCAISQWDNTYRLIRTAYRGKVTRLKATIKPKDAFALIFKLDLEETPSGMFRSASSWRLPSALRNK